MGQSLEFQLKSSLIRVSQGKVRDMYELPYHPNKLLIVTTDRISIFDRVLSCEVPQKGIVLNCISHLWFQKIEGWGFKHHMIAAGSEIDQYLPEALRGIPELQARAMVVKKLKMIPVEFVYRNCLTGSGLTSYKKDGTVCGHQLPEGLQDGDELPDILFTPTSKSQDHDEPLDHVEVESQYSEVVSIGLQIFSRAIAEVGDAGITLADTKFEFGIDVEGNVVLADEVLTPDSSRFWFKSEWIEGLGKDVRTSPSSLDKQPVRNWGRELGIDKLTQAEVDVIEVPQSIVGATANRYRYIFWRLNMESDLQDYLSFSLGLDVNLRHHKIVIVVGSKSDLPVVWEAMDRLENDGSFAEEILDALPVYEISCHRTFEDLFNFVQFNCHDADRIIAVGGKAFALPGVLKAMASTYLDREIQVVGVAVGDPTSESYEAAMCSISQLPEKQVIMDEFADLPYNGIDGMFEALDRALTGEFPPVPTPKVKKADFTIKRPKKAEAADKADKPETA